MMSFKELKEKIVYFFFFSFLIYFQRVQEHAQTLLQGRGREREKENPEQPLHELCDLN